MRIIHVTALLAMNGSLMLAIPEAVAESLKLAPDTPVNLELADTRLIIEPRPRPRYRLADLVRQCDPSARLSEQDHIWIDAMPACAEEA